MRLFYIIFLYCLFTAGVIAQTEQVHIVAVRTLRGDITGSKMWGPTIEYLNASIPGHRFILKTYPHLKSQLADAKQNKFEFIFTNPSTYIEVHHLTGARALLTLINKRQGTAQSRFGSVIFTRADRDDILTFQNLRGKHLMAVSPLAFGGWRIAWYEMLKDSFDPYTDLGHLSFANGNHPRVVYAVREGKADAGVVRTDMLERMAASGAIKLTEFRILHNVETAGFPFFHSTPLYPEWPFAVMPGVDPELTAKVKQVLLSIKPQQPAARAGQYVGWTEALDYRSVDDLHKFLKVGHYKSKRLSYNKFVIPAIVITIILIIMFVIKYKKRVLF